MTTLTGGVGENVTTGGTGTGFNIGVDLAGILGALTGSAGSLIPGGVSENELIQNYGGGSEVTNYYTPIQDNRSVAVAKAASVAPGLNATPINPAQSPLTGGVNDSEFQPSAVTLGPALSINLPALGTGQNAPKEGMIRIGQQDYPKGAVTADASGAIPPEARNYSDLERELESARQQAEVRNAQAAQQMNRELQQAQRPPLQAQAPMMAPQPAQMPPSIPMPDTSNPNAPMMPPAQPMNPYEQYQKMIPQHVGGGYSANPEQSDRLNVYRNAHAAAIQQNLDVLKPKPFQQPVDPRSYDWRMRARAALDPRVAKALNAHMQQQWSLYDKQIQRREQEVRQARANLVSLTNTGFTQEAQIAKTEFNKAFGMAQAMMMKGMPTAANYNLMGRWVTEAYPPGPERDRAIAGVYQGSNGMMNLRPWENLPQPEFKSVAIEGQRLANRGKEMRNDFNEEMNPMKIQEKRLDIERKDMQNDILGKTQEAVIAQKNSQSVYWNKKNELYQKYGEAEGQMKFEKFKQQNKKAVLASLKDRERSLRSVQTRYDKLAQNMFLQEYLSAKPNQKEKMVLNNPQLATMANEFETIGAQLGSVRQGLASIESMRNDFGDTAMPPDIAPAFANMPKLVPPPPAVPVAQNPQGFQRGSLLKRAAQSNPLNLRRSIPSSSTSPSVQVQSIPANAVRRRRRIVRG